MIPLAPGVTVKKYAKALLSAGPQLVGSPRAVAGLSASYSANVTARSATINRNVYPGIKHCFLPGLFSMKQGSVVGAVLRTEESSAGHKREASQVIMLPIYEPNPQQE